MFFDHFDGSYGSLYSSWWITMDQSWYLKKRRWIASQMVPLEIWKFWDVKTLASPCFRIKTQEWNRPIGRVCVPLHISMQRSELDVSPIWKNLVHRFHWDPLARWSETSVTIRKTHDTHPNFGLWYSSYFIISIVDIVNDSWYYTLNHSGHPIYFFLPVSMAPWIPPQHATSHTAGIVHHLQPMRSMGFFEWDFNRYPTQIKYKKGSFMRKIHVFRIFHVENHLNKCGCDFSKNIWTKLAA